MRMNVSEKARKAALMGLLLAVAVALAWCEQMLPPLPYLPPNFRYGLSTIAGMCCFFQVGRAGAATLNGFKSLFVVLTRGPIAGAMSLCGGMAAILALIVLSALLRERLTFVLAGVSAALAHNLGQISAAAIAVRTNILPAYLPALIAAGVITGTLTGTLLRICFLSLEKFTKR
jgi:heptaprenyl diphosphate synthase